MNEYQTLSHTKWECKYHVVFIPKYRRKVLYGQLRSYLGDVFRELARQKESWIEEGHLQVDHVHMLLSIPPKYAVAQVVGYLKGKSAIHIARTYGGRQQNFVGEHFWAPRPRSSPPSTRSSSRRRARARGPPTGAVRIVQEEISAR